MNNPFLVSVIIPVFNVKPYLAEALDSVINQTYKNLEIIIVDDGSTDGSGTVCGEYAGKDERIILIRQNNRGLSGARNAGLNIMKGEMVVFIDPDDALHPDYVGSMVGDMIREKCDMVVCRYSVQKTLRKMSTKSSVMIEPRCRTGKFNRESALRAIADGSINVSVWNKLYRAELWQSVRYPEDRVYEDVATAFQIFSLCSSVYVSGSVLYMNRRGRPGSITNTHSWKNFKDYDLAVTEFDDFIRKNTPDIFPMQTMKERQQKRINCLVGLYAKVNSGKTSGNKAAVMMELKEQIIATGRQVGIKNCGIRTRVAYRMLCSFPKLLNIAYPAYKSARWVARLVCHR